MKKEKQCLSEASEPLHVSVIVPVYKVEDYLDKCVNSLLNQTYKEMDIILVDDGSPDECPQMCDHFASQNKNVVALHKKNGGLSDARNFGVNSTHSEWIAFVDSDDYVEPEYIETLVQLKRRFDADLVITRTVRENIDGTKRRAIKEFESTVVDKQTALYRVYSGINVGWAAYGKLFKREVLLKHPFPVGYYEDCACMYKIIDASERIAIGDYENNYHYVQREGSILISPLTSKHYRIFEIVDEFESFIHRNYPEMEILSVTFHKRAVTQLFALQKMNWSQYREVFYKYRDYFRSNRKLYFTDKRVSRKNKMTYTLLCGRPEVYMLARKVANM